MSNRRLLRHLPILMLLVMLMLLSSISTYRITQQLGLAELQATGLQRLDLYSASLEQEIGKYAFLPGTLSLEPDVLALLKPGQGDKSAARVNAYLEQLNERAGTLSIYVIDTAGHVVASSNWRRADSFVGEELTFRPYFREALERGHSRFFGIGTTRSEPGYYLASTLVEGNKALGVAVIKVSLEQLEKIWTTVEAPAMVSDENGVIILGSVAQWKFSTLRPLDQDARSRFDQTKQYNRRALNPLGIKELRKLEHGARLVSIDRDRSETGPADAAYVYPVDGRFLAQSQPLPGTPWTLTVLSHLEQVDGLAQSRSAVAVVVAALLGMFGLIANQRRHRMKERLDAREALQKAHDELERKVHERTADLCVANQQLHDEVAERIRAEQTLRAAQDDLVQAGKLAAIGQLSTGIAHELNQPLAALRTLSGNGVRLLDRGDIDTTRSNLERIAQLADRMGRITGQLHIFARKSGGQLQAVALGRALDNALALLEQRLMQAHAEVRRCCPLPEPVAWCDAHRLEQVLINLIGNALDAMQGQSAPCIELGCDNIGCKARLTVRDYGPGLSEDTIKHLFEPFFTTKDAGVGLGLGLTISADIIRAFGGTLTGANHPEGGALFTLEIPLYEDRLQHDGT
jgi:C4-dicarboxylate-specific signal transduction histidine kinase